MMEYSLSPGPFKMRKPFVSALIALGLALGLSLGGNSRSFAQLPVQLIEPSYLSISEGLSSPSVNDILQDSYGLIWLGTANGLQKYDGYRFETFKQVSGKPNSLRNNYIWSLWEDDNHDIWVTHRNGISRYIRKKNEFRNYDLGQLVNYASGSAVAGYRLFKDSQNRLWANTWNAELMRYDAAADTWKHAEYEVPGRPEPVREGSSHGVVEDRAGNLWLASSLYGLMRMRKNEKSFKPLSLAEISGIDFSIEDNRITALFVDSTNTLWMTTRTGVHKYHPASRHLKTLIKYTENNSDRGNQINSILSDPAGNLWITNNYRGIVKFDGISDRYTEIQIAGKLRMRSYGWNTTITQMITDRSGIFWFATRESGLMKYDPVNKPFQHLRHNPLDPKSLSSGGAFGILASRVKPGITYMGTRGGGVSIYNPKKQEVEKITFRVIDDMYGGSARSIAEKPDGSLWLGTWGDGLVELDRNYKEIRRFKYDSANSNSLSHNQVRVIKPDKQGRLWLGTNNGLNILDTRTSLIRRVVSVHGRQYSRQLVTAVEKLMHSPQLVGKIDKVADSQDISQPVEIKEAGEYRVMAVAEMDPLDPVDQGWIENENKEVVWKMSKFEVAMHAGGAYKNRMEIARVHLEPGTYRLRYKTDDSHAYGKWNEAPPDLTSLYGIALMRARAEDRLEPVPALTDAEKRGLYTSGVNINDIEITDKYVWVASEGSGVDRIDPVTEQVTNFVNDPENLNSLASNNVKDIFADSKGVIWLATNEGLTTLNPVSGKFTRYTETDGLPTNLVEGVVEGDDGEMWLATQNGLSQMVINERLGKATFINYNSSDDLGTDEFLSLTQTRGADGRFYFGGEHGLTTFMSMTSNKTPPAIVISNFFINNRSVWEMGEDSPLTDNLYETRNISLAHGQNNLSFEFAALHYANPQKNQYAHMLKGYDNEWIYDNRNFAAYTNLDPGKYEFLIRASNAFGVWNEEGLKMEITILPPWWRTGWAYALYALLFISSAYMMDRTARVRIKNRERERSRERELRQAREIEKAYTELKATQNQLIQSEKMASLGELTAGIAHEIQNPLNFVNNFSEVSSELLQEMTEELNKGDLEEAKAIADDVRQNLEKISHHGKRADAIVKGMLQHSRASSGQKELTDINALCDEYLRLAYHGLRAKDKSGSAARFNAKFETDFDDHIPAMNLASQEIGRVILNLINNAFYAVNEKQKSMSAGYVPTVTIATRMLGDSVEVRVTDNGNGIPEAVKEKIFQPFFTTKPTGHGTGLGLSLAYDIVTKGHGGELKVESTIGEGSVFSVILPCDDKDQAPEGGSNA